MNLLETTRALLDARPRTMTLPDVAAGADLQRTWLAAFSQGKIADPGVRKVQALHDFLAQHVRLPE